MKQDIPRSDTLVWADLEMTGLDVETERIIELAFVVTDWNLEEIARGPELVLHQPEPLLDAMDAWNTEHHTASGLVERVRASTITERAAELEVLEFLKLHCAAGTAPLAGNSVWQDRRFIAKYMPELDGFLHYRIVDVSSVKELCRRWAPEVFDSAPPKRESHRALGDILESIQELAHYRSKLF